MTSSTANHLKVEINPREDKNNSIFYIGKIKFPGSIDCTNGVTFLIFISEEGEEELQIAPIDKEKQYSKYKKLSDRVSIALESRKDQFDKVFYICRFKFPGIIECNKQDGVAFVVFLAKSGFEELQIVAPIKSPGGAKKVKTKIEPEISKIRGGRNRERDGI